MIRLVKKSPLNKLDSINASFIVFMSFFSPKIRQTKIEKNALSCCNYAFFAYMCNLDRTGCRDHKQVLFFSEFNSEEIFAWFFYCHHFRRVQASFRKFNQSHDQALAPRRCRDGGPGD